jgi:hypothetical protein
MAAKKPAATRTAAPRSKGAGKQRAATRGAGARPSLSPEFARRAADAAEAAGAERLTAVERAADQLRRYLNSHRPILLVVAPLILAGSARAPQLILDGDLSFRVISTSGRGRSSLDRVSAAEIVELWGAADLYDRIEAALRTAAGLKSRPTGAIVAGLGVAGDHGAKV